MALTELGIKNFILVKSTELEFHPGLNIITGETGAGKSLLVGAINLLTGGKVDWDTVTGEERAEITGIFEATEKAKAILEEQGIEVEDEIIIRRTLNPLQRKSRSFVNMTPVTQQFLKTLTSALVDIHGQHEHQSLFNVATHLYYLDKFAGNDELRSKFKEAYETVQRIKRDVEREKREIEQIEKMREFLEFQLKELEEAELKPGEDEELEERINVLSNLEALREGISNALADLYEGDGSAYTKINRVKNILNDLAKIDQTFLSDTVTLEEILIKIEEIWRSLLDYSNKLESEPEELDRLIARQSRLARLKEKYKTDILGLIKLLEETRKKLSRVEIRDEVLSKLKKELDEKEKELKILASKLSESRREAAKRFEELVMRELHDLGMEKAIFVVSIREKEIDETGGDEVEFLITTNPGEPPRPIRKIASGGELSRVMLALKTVLSDIDDIPTLIFDEIDVGIGGRIAEVVGKKLRGIARKRQVIAITHLPQIAVYGEKHFVVEKSLKEDLTVTYVREVSGKERIHEIARMLAGEEITESSIQHAKELIKSAEK